ncbi:MAG: flagellar biosynthesis regulator FlaF [Rhizobiaceae bacterium]
MYQLEYADIEQDALVDARMRERQLLKRSIDLLETARNKGESSMELVEATHFTRRLWTAFLDDLAQDDNQLPKEMRANLISIGIWVLNETERIRQGESTDFDGIIEISQTIMEGVS